MFGFGKKDKTIQGNEPLNTSAVAKPGRKATIRARVFRKATGKWEDLGVIARPTLSEEQYQRMVKGGAQ